MGKIAGVDEAGRGPWAGPVVAACVVLDGSLKDSTHIRDSKSLSPKKREELYKIILSTCEYGIGMASPEEIDENGIIKATEIAIKRAIESMRHKPSFLLVDGSDRFDLPIRYKSIKSGDKKVRSISAASIVAKVWRDKYMKLMDDMYPGYGFARHKGYGTRHHADALRKLGVSSIHRRSFKPVREIGTRKEKLLLHVCCAPCATSVLERLKNRFDVTMYFYNPNIHPKSEFLRRLGEVEKLARLHEIGLLYGTYEVGLWFKHAKVLRGAREGSVRCWMCYALRLLRTAQMAKKMGIKYFSTTLSVSPLKRFERIKHSGLRIAGMYGLEFVDEDFKKKDGFKRSCELSKSFDLYRQNYCGCIYSRRV